MCVRKKEEKRRIYIERRFFVVAGWVLNDWSVCVRMNLSGILFSLNIIVS